METLHKKHNTVVKTVDLTALTTPSKRLPTVRAVPALSDAQLAFYAGLQKTSMFSLAQKSVNLRAAKKHVAQA